MSGPLPCRARPVAVSDRAAPLDPQREARALLALATHVLVGHLTPQEAHDVLHARLAGLWEQPARQQ
ncbi:hypothetical protein GCM10010309_68800 [Streptomyces violaceochromogenes]|nr:hypothetical protein GCM10010309_68800 [Streptomyces violaceochromogenes]